MRTSASLVVALLTSGTLAAQRPIPSPASSLGFPIGTERRLVEWDVITRYFRTLDAASDRVLVRELGRTTNGNPFLVAFISSPLNLSRLPALRDVQRRLADPRTIPTTVERDRLLRDGRTFVLITSSIHSTEVGGFFAPMEIAYRLATARSADERRILDETVLMLVPSMNPDGITIVSRWYNQTVGTNAEGTAPPELYHHYTGHDNNRDWYAFTQVETRMVVDSLYGVYRPQVTMDIHQQSPYGARMFVPPYLDPVEPNVDPLIVQGVNALGLEIARRMTLDGFAGLSVSATYDAWTPARAYQHYHGAVRILTETASASLATSLTLTLDSLRPGRGFDARAASWNFVAPWPGGRWTLADIIAYQAAGAFAMLDHVARHAEQWRRTSFLVAERAIRGWEGWPYAFVLPTTGQNDTGLHALLDLLRRGQVEVRQALAPVVIGGERFSPGAYVVVLRQPYAAFAKALLERQSYPDLREYPGGPPREPYDVTAHTLPLLLGVRAIAVQESLPAPLTPPIVAEPPVYRAALSATNGSGRPSVRIGLYRSWAPVMDEGWTRWVFDTWGVPYETVTDSVIRSGNLGERFDAIILPDQPPRQILEGLSSRRYPVRFAGGMGQSGVAALADFVDGGGTLIALNEASTFAASALALPVADVLAGISPREFYAPGSIFRIELDADHPLAAGVGSEAIAWFQRGPAFEVRNPLRARIVARYPSDPGNVLLSGWVLGPQHVTGRGALVEVTRGRGRVILFGFRPQYRGQSLATFPLLFNALRRSAR